MEVDSQTGEITEPLSANTFIYGYVIEFEFDPRIIPEPATAALMPLALSPLLM